MMGEQGAKTRQVQASVLAHKECREAAKGRFFIDIKDIKNTEEVESNGSKESD